MNTTQDAIHQKALTLAKAYRRCEADLIAILQEIDHHRIYLVLGYESLYAYAIEALHLSDSTALSFISVARKAREIPEIHEALQAGSVTVSKIRKLSPALTRENAGEWLQKASLFTQREIEEEVAKVVPKAEPPVSLQAVSSNRMALQMGLSEELVQKLLRVQDLLSQREKRSVNLEGAQEVLVSEFLERHDPVKRAERAIERKQSSRQRAKVQEKLADSNQPTFTGLASLQELRRRHLVAMVKHKVMHRDLGQCTFLHGNGRRCRQRRFLEMHHIIPVAQGGRDRPENLRLLCSPHHKLAHVESYMKRRQAILGTQMPMMMGSSK